MAGRKDDSVNKRLGKANGKTPDSEMNSVPKLNGQAAADSLESREVATSSQDLTAGPDQHRAELNKNEHASGGAPDQATSKPTLSETAPSETSATPQAVAGSSDVGNDGGSVLPGAQKVGVLYDAQKANPPGDTSDSDKLSSPELFEDTSTPTSGSTSLNASPISGSPSSSPAAAAVDGGSDTRLARVDAPADGGAVPPLDLAGVSVDGGAVTDPAPAVTDPAPPVTDPAPPVTDPAPAGTNPGPVDSSTDERAVTNDASTDGEAGTGPAPVDTAAGEGDDVGGPAPADAVADGGNDTAPAPEDAAADNGSDATQASTDTMVAGGNDAAPAPKGDSADEGNDDAPASVDATADEENAAGAAPAGATMAGPTLTLRPLDARFQAWLRLLSLAVDRDDQADVLLRQVLDRAQGKQWGRGKARRVGRAKGIRYRGSRAHRLAVELGCVRVHASSRVKVPKLPL